jgi:hypothetical protein
MPVVPTLKKHCLNTLREALGAEIVYLLTADNSAGPVGAVCAHQVLSREEALDMRLP